MYDHEKSDERIKRLMEQLGYPNSISHYTAFKQLENEIRGEYQEHPKYYDVGTDTYKHATQADIDKLVDFCSQAGAMKRILKIIYTAPADAMKDLEKKLDV